MESERIQELLLDGCFFLEKTSESLYKSATLQWIIRVFPEIYEGIRMKIQHIKQFLHFPFRCFPKRKSLLSHQSTSFALP